MHPVGDRRERRSFSDIRAAVPEAIPVLRRAVVDFVHRAGADEQQCEAVRLAISEAVTNVVLHAYREEGGPVEVSATLAGGDVWVLVADDGRGLGAPSARPGLGQGLALIGAVSDSIAVLRRPTGGTELRLRFSLRSRTAARGRPAPVLRPLHLAHATA